MRLHESVEEGIDVFALEGEIDLHYAPVLRTLLQGKTKARTPALILDLAGVTFIDSTGLGTIIEYFRDASRYSGLLCLTGLNDELKNIFAMVRLDGTIPIFPGVKEAIAALKAGTVRPPDPALFGSAVDAAPGRVSS
jgi:anti-sigma B factor antagonist